MAEWLDKMHEAQRFLRQEAAGLRDLADAFRRTGNREVAAELEVRADSISASEQQVGEALGQLLDEQLRGAREQTDSLFVAVLGGAFNGAPGVKEDSDVG